MVLSGHNTSRNVCRRHAQNAPALSALHGVKRRNRCQPFKDCAFHGLDLWQPSEMEVHTEENTSDIARFRQNDRGIRNEITGNMSTEPAEKQQSKGVTIGNLTQRPCFVCHRHIAKDGKRRVQKTSFWCKECHMPLCQVSRVRDDGGRTMTCCEEHQCDGGLFGCNGMHKKSAEVPDEGEIDLHPRRSDRTRNNG